MFFCVSKETEKDMLWQRDTEKSEAPRKRASARTKVRKRARDDGNEALRRVSAARRTSQTRGLREADETSECAYEST